MTQACSFYCGHKATGTLSWEMATPTISPSGRPIHGTMKPDSRILCDSCKDDMVERLEQAGPLLERPPGQWSGYEKLRWTPFEDAQPGILKIDSEQVVYAIYMLNDHADECTFVSAHPSMNAAKTAREDLPGYDGATGPIILPVRLVPVPVNETPPSEWIPSRSIEANPQQLVGKRVELASKDGGGWRGTVASVGYTVVLVDGTTLPWQAGGQYEPFQSQEIYMFDIARARIID
jgi:hypothetical protein